MENKYHVSDLSAFIQITQDKKEDVFLFRKDRLSNIEVFPIKEHGSFAVDLSYVDGSMRAEFSVKDEVIAFSHQVVDLVNK